MYYCIYYIICYNIHRARPGSGSGARFVKGYNGKFFENAVRRLKPVAKFGPRAEIDIFELKFSHSEVGPTFRAAKKILRGVKLFNDHLRQHRFRQKMMKTSKNLQD